MQKYINLLKWLWLGENATKVYLSLLENWSSSIVDIANNTNLHRVQIYRLLPTLIDWWFVLLSKEWKRKIYNPAQPEIINQEYEKILKNQRNLVEELNDKYSNLTKKTNVIFKKWLKWIHNVYNDIVNSLDKWDVFYRITSEIDVDKINNHYIPKWYKDKRDKKEIERYIIMSDKTASLKKPKLEREIKIIDSREEKFDDNIIFTIYADKVSYVDFNTETSILIESKEIADFQKKVFKLLFKNLK